MCVCVDNQTEHPVSLKTSYTNLEVVKLAALLQVQGLCVMNGWLFFFLVLWTMTQLFCKLKKKGFFNVEEQFL